LLLLVVWLVARRPRAERWRALVRYAGPAVLVGVAFSWRYLQLEDPTLGMLELASHEGVYAPSAVVDRLLRFLSFGTLGWAVRLAFGVLLALSVVVMARAVWRRTADGPQVDGERDVQDLVATWGWALVLLALLGPVLLPWYVVWALPVAWVLPREPRLALLATSALLAVSMWSAEPLRFPGAYEVNLALVRWVVTPILLVLALRALLDLRRRAERGLPFAERGLVVPRVAARGAAEGEEQVASAAGQR
jgi:hypothetical protein